MQRSLTLGAIRSSAGARKVGLPILFAGLVALGSQIRVPIPGNPVPLTLQVIFVLLAGAFLRPAAAAVSMALFVTIGVLGAPVFAGGGAGLAYLLGPTGGYLAGFVAGAAVCSLVLQGRRASIPRTVLSMSIAMATIYALGALHLTAYLGGDLAAGFRLGVVPFLPAGLAKLAVAVAIASGTSGFSRKGGGTSSP